MGKTTVILFLLFVCLSGFGQTDRLIKKLLFDLPLDASGRRLNNKILSDKRFQSKSAGRLPNWERKYPTFWGLCFDNGFVKLKPDSIELELNWATGIQIVSERKTKFPKFLVITANYYYKSKDTTEKEYRNLLALLKPIFTDTSTIYIDTIYSDSPIRSQYKAHGMTFTKRDYNYGVEILSASITKNYFALSIKYSRKYDESVMRFKNNLPLGHAPNMSLQQVGLDGIAMVSGASFSSSYGATVFQED